MLQFQISSSFKMQSARCFSQVFAQMVMQVIPLYPMFEQYVTTDMTQPAQQTGLTLSLIQVQMQACFHMTFSTQVVLG